MHGEDLGLPQLVWAAASSLLLVGLQVLQMPPRRRGMRTCEVITRGDPKGGR